MAFFIRAEVFNTRRYSATLCAVTHGIKAGCIYLIEHTVRNIEHCTPMLCAGGVDFNDSLLITFSKIVKKNFQAFNIYFCYAIIFIF